MENIAMLMNPIEASKNIRNEFIDYIASTFPIADSEYAKKFKEALKKENFIAKGPFLEIMSSYEVSKSIRDLVNEGILSKGFNSFSKEEIDLDRKLYSHQVKSILKINEEKNLVITTGTGSGKTECFLLPILSHLLEEEKNGALSDGVRAVILYPMNALANDQMKRLRQILKNQSKITFGIYTGSTKEEHTKALDEYKNLNNQQEPLKNEVLSRDDMRKSPPHILITNYSMLEYMLMRPKDAGIFNTELKFLVLDEAHIYKGAKGIDIALLIRRLKARIKNPKNVKHILTSATLGNGDSSDDIEIVNFAQKLCDAIFDTESIIRSKVIIPTRPSKVEHIPLELFHDLAYPNKKVENIFSEYKQEFDTAILEENRISFNLYNLCFKSDIYWILHEIVQVPTTIDEIAEKIRQNSSYGYEDISAENIADIVIVASQAADENDIALFKARFHMFVRELEGCYITLPPYKNVLLTRQSEYNKKKVFELVICKKCGRIGIINEIEENNITKNYYNKSRKNYSDSNIEMYLFDNLGEEFFDEEDKIDKNEYVICSVCGEIQHKSIGLSCEHDSFVTMKKIEPTENGNFSCPCGARNISQFYLNYEDATAILGITLFEQLPDKKKKLETIENKKSLLEEDSEYQDLKHLFNSLMQETENQIQERECDRQFLTFTDNRSDAAYFASYISEKNKEFLRRAVMWRVIENHQEDMYKNPWDISQFVNEIKRYFEENELFEKDNIDNQAWLAVLYEMINSQNRISLTSLGVLRFLYKRNEDEDNSMKKLIKHLIKLNYNHKHLSESELKNLFDTLIWSMVCDGAIEIERLDNGDRVYSLTEDEEEYLKQTKGEKRYILNKDSLEKKNSNIKGWSPAKGYSNNRLLRLQNALGIEKETALFLLNNYWKVMLLKKLTKSTNKKGENVFYLETNAFKVQAGLGKLPIYRCNKCGKTTIMSYGNQCINPKCDGQLQEIVNYEKFLQENYYASTCIKNSLKPLFIKEHTAQLGKLKKEEYQQKFLDHVINALSCSTTFELGVDVGDLETIYLRNVPPTTSNYVQRAGRAGRSILSTAYVLTYSKLSSHDLSYFKKPEKLICGEIGVPVFSLFNKQMILRHIFAIALSSFFQKYPTEYNGKDVTNFITKQEDSDESGFDRFKLYLQDTDNKKALKKLLINSFSDNLWNFLFNTSGDKDYFFWVDDLIGENGLLTVAIEKYNMDVELYAKNDATFEIPDLMKFLIQNNILPKYGFPTDTVELKILNKKQKFDQKPKLERDLQLAISEYAPDSQIVVDGQLYTSRYNKFYKNGEAWNFSQVAKCKCGYWNHSSTVVNGCCVACGAKIPENKWETSIDPIRGFVADKNFLKKLNFFKRLGKKYKSEVIYLGDNLRRDVRSHTFQLKSSCISVETSKNDSLMVVGNDKFYVCFECGYASENKPNISDHKNCNNKEFEMIRLNHVFRTDVVKLDFSMPSSDKATLLSVMYALLEGISKTFDIERSDIQGCLQGYLRDSLRGYSIILYDTISDGTGQIHRMVLKNDDFDVESLQKVIEKAIEITQNCDCDPSCYSCLRNYYNQGVHDMIDRKKAEKFLQLLME